MMEWVERAVVVLVFLASAATFLHILWHRRIEHVWPKWKDVEIVRPGGLFTGTVEVLTQGVVLRNRPFVGIFHFPLFYGLLLFMGKSVIHFLNGLGADITTPSLYTWALDLTAIVVLIGVVFMVVRRYVIQRDRMTHQVESGVILGLIALLMVTQLAERCVEVGSVLETTNWWAHYLVLAVFPAVIASGKHLHLMLAPVAVVLKHMTEGPSDRLVFGNDLDMDMDDEAKLEAEYARLGMPNGVKDFSFVLFDPAACIQCGRCNDACPAGPELKPREHFVVGLLDPEVDSAALAEIVEGDTLATCVQCRACDTACPTGCRPSLNALEIRGRLTLEGLYPPRALRDTALKALTGSGNIFGVGEDERSRFIADNDIPIYDVDQDEVLLVLGCQGGNSPEVQPVVVATGKLLDAAGVKWGVLPEEKCWGEGLLHGGGLMEEWPFWAKERIEYLTEALGGDRTRAIVTICPHCRDTIRTQYGAVGADFTDVRLHTPYLLELVESGKLRIEERSAEVALHLPCKVVHNAEQKGMRRLLKLAGLTVTEPETSGSGFDTTCCGGGGGGFLWDSPAKVNQMRWQQIQATGRKAVVTGCPGCHRMLGVMRDEETLISDVATVLLERVQE